MKKVLFFALSALLIIGAGCGSSISITTDYDKEVDFNKFQTFGFLRWDEASSTFVNDISRKRLENAVALELTKRGMTRVDGMGDSMIGFHVVIENKTGTTSYTDHYGGMGYGGYGGRGGYGYGYGYPYGGGSSTTTTSTYTYKVGTVIIDQYDSQSKLLMWEGIAQGELEDDRSNQEENIRKDMLRMFENYPRAITSTEVK